MRIAIPTEDGHRIAQRFQRARAFLVTDIFQGRIEHSYLRPNPMNVHTVSPKSHILEKRKSKTRSFLSPNRHQQLLDLLLDCRCVITQTISDTIRPLLSSRGIDVIVTSEELIVRALARFSVGAIRDESNVVDPLYRDIPDGWEHLRPGSGDDFDA